MTAAPVEPFPTLDALQTEHGELLELHRGGAADSSARARAFVARAGATGAVLDKRRDRWAAQSLIDYWTTVLNRPGAEAAEPVRLADFDPGRAARPLTDADYPYPRGPAGYGDDGAWFFGRRAAVEECARRLAAPPHLVVVVGEPGSGASSLVRAGLVPALKSGAAPGSAGWAYLPVVVPGPTPLAALAAAVPGAARAHGRKGPKEAPLVKSVRSAAGGRPAVIVVDQFEELFSLCEQKADRVAFAAAVRDLVRAPGAPARVVLVLDRRYVDQAAGLPGFDLLLKDATYPVPPAGAPELREAIEGPARAVGLRFEPGLVERIAAQAVGHPTPFPLVQFILARMWLLRGDGNRLTEKMFHDAGGHRAVDKAGEGAFARLSPAGQEACRKLVLRLVRPGTGDRELVTSSAPRADLAPDGPDSPGGKALDALKAAGLVHESPDGRVVPAHEALLGQWGRLAGWAADERKQGSERKLLTTAARDWAARGRDVKALWRGDQLARAARIADLTGDEAEFVRAGQQREITDTQRQRWWFRGAITVLTVMVTYLSIVTGLLSKSRGLEQDAKYQATARGVAARSEALVATQPDLALLLAVEALDPRPDDDKGGEWTAPPEASSALLRAVEANPRLKAFVHVGGDGYNGPVFAAAYNPKGDLFVTGGADGTVRVWKADDPGHAPVKELSVGVAIRCLAFGDNLLAAGTVDGRVVLWDAATLTPRGEVTATAARESGDRVVRAVAVSPSPDGTRLMAGGWDGLVRVWDVSDRAGPPKPIGEPGNDPAHGGGVFAVAVAKTADGGLVVAAGGTGKDAGQARSVTLYDLGAGGLKHRARLEGSHFDYITALAFDRTGGRLASGSGDTRWQVWDVATEEPANGALPAYRPGDGAVTALAFGPGDTLVVGTATSSHAAADGTPRGGVELYNVNSRGAEAPLVGHRGAVRAIACRPPTAGKEADELVTAGDDGMAILWRTGARGGQVCPPSGASAKPITAVALHPDGRLLASAGDDGRVVVRAADGSGMQVLLDQAKVVRDLAFGAAGERLAAAGDDGRLYLWDVPPAGREFPAPRVVPAQHVVPGPDGNRAGRPAQGVDALAFDRAGGRFVTCSRDDPAVTLWEFSERGRDGRPAADRAKNADAGPVIKRIKKGLAVPESRTGYVSVGFGGLVVAAADTTGKVRLWALAADGEPSEAKTLGLDGVRTVAVAPDGGCLATGGYDGRVELWDLAQWPPKLLPGDRPPHAGLVRKLAFHPDGEWVGSVGYDFRVGLWRVDKRTGTGGTADGHTDTVLGVSLAGPRDQFLMATCGRDRSVRKWRSPKQPGVGPDGDGQFAQGAVRAIAFRNRDGGRELAVVTDDRQLTLWSTPGTTEQPPPAARKVLGPISIGADAGSLAVDPSGRWVACGADRKTVLLDLQAPASPPVPLDHPWQETGPVRLAFSPDGSRLAVANDWGQSVVWRLADAPPAHGPVAGARAPAEVPLNAVLALRDASVARNLDLRVMRELNSFGTAAVAFRDTDDGTDGGLVTSLGGFKDMGEARAFSPDGAVLATGGWDALVRVWPTADATRKPVVLRGHDGAVGVVAVSRLRPRSTKHDGMLRLLATAPRSSGGKLLVWDAAAGRLISPVDPGTTQPVIGLAFDHDANALAWCSGDGTVHLLDLTDKALKYRAMQIANRSLTDEELCRYGLDPRKRTAARGGH